MKIYVSSTNQYQSFYQYDDKKGLFQLKDKELIDDWQPKW